jgi:hypothetical protein
MTMPMPVTPTVPAPAPSTTTPAMSPPKPASVAVRVKARQRGSALSVGLQVPAGAKGARARLVLTQGGKTIAQLTRTGLRTGASTLTLPLNATGVRLLRANRQLRVKLVATFITPSGRRVNTTGTLVLHRAGSGLRPSHRLD